MNIIIFSSITYIDTYHAGYFRYVYLLNFHRILFKKHLTLMRSTAGSPILRKLSTVWFT